MDYVGVKLAAAVGLGAVLVTGCGKSAPGPEAAPSFTYSPDPVATVSLPAEPDFSAPAPTPIPSCALKAPDVIERFLTPGAQWNAQLLGGVNIVSCKLSVDTIASETSPLDGFCTQVAEASDNPGYDVDAVPAPPLKDVVNEVGASC